MRTLIGMVMVRTICYSISVRILRVTRLTHQHLRRCSVSSEQTTIFSLTSSFELRLPCSDTLLANCTNHDPAGLGSASPFRRVTPDNKSEYGGLLTREYFWLPEFTIYYCSTVNIGSHYLLHLRITASAILR